jgi:hypothetical protein
LNVHDESRSPSAPKRAPNYGGLSTISVVGPR